MQVSRAKVVSFALFWANMILLHITCKMQRPKLFPATIYVSLFGLVVVWAGGIWMPRKMFSLLFDPPVRTMQFVPTFLGMFFLILVFVLNLLIIIGVI